MKLRFLFYILAALMLTASCVESGSNRRRADEEGEPIPTDSALPELDLYEKRQIPTSADDNFEDFIYAFITDDEFAEARMDSAIVEIEDGEAYMVEPEEWDGRHLFKYQELYAYIYSNPADSDRIKSDQLEKVTVEFVKLETMKADRYVFVNGDGKWRMRRIIHQTDVDQAYTAFLDFYSRFVEDKDFQMASVAQPLTLIIGTESEMDEGGTAELSPEEWSEFHSQTPMPDKNLVLMDYGQTIAKGGNLYLMVRSITEAVSATYKFRKTRDGWKLQSVEIL